MKSQSLEKRKESLQKNKEIDPFTGCWNFTGSRNNQGYGWFSINGKAMGAHRASWILFRGEIPEGQIVCHKCDNPQCVNPDHLFVGTNQDNRIDCENKGRSNRVCGEESPWAKLTSMDVLVARKLFFSTPNARRSGSKIGKENLLKLLSNALGVSTKTLRDAINGKQWKHVPFEKTEEKAA